MDEIFDEAVRLLDEHTLGDLNILDVLAGAEPTGRTPEELIPTLIGLIFGCRSAVRFLASKLEDLAATGTR